MDSSFTTSFSIVEREVQSPFIPLSSGMRRTMVESIITSVALFALGSAILLNKGDLGSLVTSLEAGRVCLALSAGGAIMSVLTAAAASRRWPGWEIPSFSVRLLVASLALLAIGGMNYGNRWGRIFTGIALLGATSSLFVHKLLPPPPGPPEPSKRLFLSLNDTVTSAGTLNQTLFRPPSANESEETTNLSLTLDPENIMDQIGCVNLMGAVELCAKDIEANLSSLCLVLLVNELLDDNGCSKSVRSEELIDSIADRLTDKQHIMLNWFAVFCASWVTDNDYFLDMADEFAMRSMKPDDRAPFLALSEKLLPVKQRNLSEDLNEMAAALDATAFDPSATFVANVNELRDLADAREKENILNCIYRTLASAKEEGLESLQVLITMVMRQQPYFEELIPEITPD